MCGFGSEFAAFGTLLQASAACCSIASKVTVVSQFSPLSSNLVHCKQLSPNSSKTRCIGSSLGVRPLACSARDDVDCADNLTTKREVSQSSNDAAEASPWQQKGGQVFALLLATLQAVAPIPFDGIQWGAGPAEAVLYSPDTKVPRSAEVALRRAIPAVNPSMKSMQESLEEIFYLLRIPQRKPYGKSTAPCFI